MVVGGTGLYISRLLKGISEIPDLDPAIRKFFSFDLAKSKLHDIYSILKFMDPTWALHIKKDDTQRILRAWEVLIGTGRPISQFQGHESGLLDRFQVELFYWILDYPRELTNRRISERTRRILADGLIAETRGLIDRGIELNSIPMKSIGYKQAVDFLNGKISSEDLEERIIIATRQYAKRQRTWFRKELAQLITEPERLNREIILLKERVKSWNNENKC
jgi:tRNA dimethylallyltransferase